MGVLRTKMVDLFDTERIVEEMSRKADAVVRDVMSEFHISHVVAGFSGGDDSIVSTHWAMEKFGDAALLQPDLRVAYHYAGNHQDCVIRQLGWDFERVSPEPEGAPRGWTDPGKNNEPWVDSDTSYEEFCLNFGFPGNAQHALMYQRLKQRAFRKIKGRLGNRPRKSRVMIVSGIRQDESAIRAGYKRAYAEEASECFVWVNPFYYCSALDFEAYRQEFGLPRNPVKAKVGISGECECGAHAAEGEREAISAIEPTFADYLFRWLEPLVMERFPWRWDEKPPSWFTDARRGQQFLFEPCDSFTPGCVGCSRRKSVS